jgi:acyl carrier protein
MLINSAEEILSSLVATTFERSVDHHIALSAQLPKGWGGKLADLIKAELQVSVTNEQFDSCTLVELSRLVESALIRNGKGETIGDVYSKLKEVASDSIYHDIKYSWFSSWDGDLFKSSDSLERVELISRMEEEFGVLIPDQDVSSLETVGQTVRYLWRLST